MSKQRNARRSRSKHSIEQALALHRGGRLDEAERAYNAILAADPQHGEALHLCGFLKHQQGRSSDGLRLVASALKAKPGSVDVLTSYGVILDALGRREEALENFDRALAQRAGDAVIHYNRGNAFKGLGRHQDALASYDRAIALAPDLGPAHNNRGSAYAALDRNEEALSSFNKAIALTLRRAGIRIADDVSLAGCELGGELRDGTDKALAADPNSTEMLNNRGQVLNRLRRYDEAIASFDTSLTLRRDQSDALCHRGEALAAVGRFDDALADFGQALRIDPNCADALLKRGNALYALNRVDEALRSFAAAVAVKPDNPEANFNEGLARLCLGDFRAGWKKYEHRWGRAEFAKERPNYPRPMWRGEKDIAGKTVLLVAEQGLGDAIQFARYAPLVAALGAEVWLGVRPSLTALMATVPGVSRVFGGGETLPAFDLYCPLLSLPVAFDTALETIPSRVPYIRSPDDRIAKWNGCVPQTGRLRVGLCWSGTKSHLNDRNRSIALDRLAPILTVANVDFFSLQKDVGDADRERLRRYGVAELGQAFADFADTAAVVSTLDLVISVDTSVAHLAGAMARATALLLPFAPDFRWMLGRTDSPWYPTMRLYRQSAIGDWSGPIERIHRELSAVASRR